MSRPVATTRAASLMRLKDCPRKSKHTKAPTTYIAWHDWAEKKSKTHRQIRCPGCNLFAIWVPKKKRVKK